MFPIHIPPLRERGADITLLADYFIQKYAAQLNKTVTRINSPAIEALMAYHWPGNVRELENCMERACLVAREAVLHAADIWWLDTPTTAATSASSVHGNLSPLDTAEQLALRNVLEQHQWNFTRAATALNLSRSTLYLKAAKYGLTRSAG